VFFQVKVLATKLIPDIKSLIAAAQMMAGMLFFSIQTYGMIPIKKKKKINIQYTSFNTNTFIVIIKHNI
jgi:hypothetical protein